MSLLNPSGGGGTPTPTPAPTPTPTPAPSDGTGGGTGGADDGTSGGDRPDWLPETAWKDGAVDLTGLQGAFEGAGKAADLPAAADAYQMPTIDGFDGEKAKGSPLFKALMAGAHANGVGQAGFEGIVTDYVGQMTADATAAETAERAALGENADNRLKAVSTWLSSSLPAEEAAAVMATATTAKAIVGLEKLMNARATPAPRDPPPTVQQGKTREEIQALMRTPAYYDAKKRDPAVVAEVDAWYKAQDAAAQAGKK